MAKKDNLVAVGFDKEYYDWIAELSHRYRQSQIKAAVRVNDEMLKFYWSVGKDIAEHQLENLSRDWSLALNRKKGFGPTSLWYTKSFYNLYSPLLNNLQQVAEESDRGIFQQVAEDLEILFCIPWSHHQIHLHKRLLQLCNQRLALIPIRH